MSLSALSSEVGNPLAARTHLQLLRLLLSLHLHPERLLTPFFTPTSPLSRLQQYIPYPDSFSSLPISFFPPGKSLPLLLTNTHLTSLPTLDAPPLDGGVQGQAFSLHVHERQLLCLYRATRAGFHFSHLSVRACVFSIFLVYWWCLV